PATSIPSRAPAEAAPLSDAIEALIALGYRPLDANRMARAADDGSKTSEEIIRAALRLLA
ncbi:MAG: Holliday junction branch migration protein RuvA, partial [Chromatiaceae bacterium]